MELMQTQIAMARRRVTMSSEDLSRVTATFAQASASLEARTKERVAIEKEMDSKRSRCEKKLHLLEASICDGLSLKKALLVEAGHDEVKDCQVGDWIHQGCSKPCDEGSGPGFEIAKRSVQLQPDPLGVACPALETRLPCGVKRCPVDCVMEEWGGWTSCSTECGGGTKSRTRGVKQSPDHGGLVCAVVEERQSCNMDSCDSDCVLSEWTPWSKCSRNCKFSASSAGGRARRRRDVVTQETGSGKCPAKDDKTRFEEKRCNQDLCPQNISCVSEQDVVLLLDASEFGNWNAEIQMARALVRASNQTVRFGIVAYAETARVLTRVTDDHERVLASLGEAPPAIGSGNDIAQGESLGRTLLIRGEDEAPRSTVALLLTEGNPTRLGPATQAAASLKGIGVRLTVGLNDRRSPEAREHACALASAPCAANIEAVNSWQQLSEEPNRFLNLICDRLSFSSTRIVER